MDSELAIRLDERGELCEVLRKSGRLLKPDDVAAIAQLPRPRVWHLIRTGQLPAVAIGRSYRILPSALADWLEGLNSPAGAA